MISKVETSHPYIHIYTHIYFLLLQTVYFFSSAHSLVYIRRVYKIKRSAATYQQLLHHDCFFRFCCLAVNVNQEETVALAVTTEERSNVKSIWFNLWHSRASLCDDEWDIRTHACACGTYSHQRCIHFNTFLSLIIHAFQQDFCSCSKLSAHSNHLCVLWEVMNQAVVFQEKKALRDKKKLYQK